ncbi:hypothetical protein CROQUDRAFT_89870 [Cronartium quercuum f. sp. fusiforme G11]|uniref:Trafficking protein particle complex subunit 11 domain-containing protein n=1 Tax=Cronartium quercuum f. sp. fusiforme G11 TaxID=708437 RepID=A0A9P6TEK0_9BASI|nr:hypothetical protein CROQUDRAFT_89870 [Cronartium quercuum f. sp. fusiforme G11]
MDSLPIEFLSHHLPLLFFAGLPVPPEDPNSGQGSSDPFQVLSTNLRHALTANQSGIQVWDPRKQTQNSHDFRVVVVEKNVRFPPRKARPSSTSSTTNSITHSPLSPLSPTSPLHPDGIMTPIWIRKHRDMVPAAFVLTLHLWEPPSSARARENVGNGIRSSEKPDPSELEQQKAHDLQLIYEIVERKKTTAERGIQLAVVILTSRTMLDNPDLDSRLGYVRKQSGLDSRASLFVLSPVLDREILAFTNTLKTELYETCIDYYREHSRRVRRKRSRSNSTTSYQSTTYSRPDQVVISPLGAQGWNVRADYKLATFAEFRQEYDVALKFYEDCWEGLSQMFSSTAILPPRTKRWAEAKVLIDCINIKICKFYLYSQETSRSLDQFRKHTARFRELCNGWGIGDETFEFWSWLSKQYTILADLIDLACRNGLRLPNLLPSPDTTANRHSQLGSLATSHTGTLGGVSIPANVLLHAGFYYYQSGICAIHRRDKFRASEIAEEQMRSITKSKDETAVFQGSAALAYERKVNHSELIIGLFTKAYELFKRFGSNRMTLFLAFKIAAVHLDNKDYGTAVKFLDRITSSYRKEKFGPILESALMMFYQTIKLELSSSQAPPDTTVSKFEQIQQILRISYELLGPTFLSVPDKCKADICTELQRIAQMPADDLLESPRVITLDMTSSSSPLRSQIVFWDSEVELGSTVDFQLTICADDTCSGYGLSFSSVELQFTNFPSIIINHHAQESVDNRTFLDVHEISESTLIFEQDLSWSETASKLLFNGRFKPSMVGKVKLDQIKFISQPAHKAWKLELITKPNSSRQAEQTSRWVCEVDPKPCGFVFVPTEPLSSSCQVRQKIALVRAEVEAEPFALLGETLDIKIRLWNDEGNEAVMFKIDARFPDGPSNVLTIDGHSFTNQLLDYTLGSVGAQQSTEKILLLQPTIPGNFRISISISAQIQSGFDSISTDALSAEETDAPLSSVWQVSKPILLDVKEPLSCSFDTRYLNQISDRPGRTLLDLSPPGVWDESERVIVNAMILSRSPIPLYAQERASANVLLLTFNLYRSIIQNASTPMRIISTSLSTSSDEAWVLEADSTYSISYVVELANGSNLSTISGCGLKITWARYSLLNSIPTHHVSQYPFHFPSRPLQTTTVTTDLPHHLRLYECCTITYTIKNFSSRHIAELAFQLHPTDQWVCSGPRRLDKIKLLPGGSRSITINGLPVMLGEIGGPQVQVFERLWKRRAHGLCFLGAEGGIEEGVEGDGNSDEEEENRARGLVEMKEIVVVRGSGTIRAREADLKASTGAATAPSLKVMVLPS